MREIYREPVMARSLGVVFALCMLCRGALRADDNWPRFRGPEGTGVTEVRRLPDHWSTTESVAWKADVPGRGWSSPIVWGEKVFLTTVVNTGKTPEARKGLYFGGEQRKAPETEHVWKVVCLNLRDGALLWEQTAHRGTP